MTKGEVRIGVGAQFDAKSGGREPPATVPGERPAPSVDAESAGESHHGRRGERGEL